MSDSRHVVVAAEVASLAGLPQARHRRLPAVTDTKSGQNDRHSTATPPV